MKTSTTKYCLAICAAVLTATTSFRAAADQATTTVPPEKTYTGTITAIDPAENTFEVKGFILSKKFNFSSMCDYTALDKGTATTADLRPGEKVTVSYQRAQGVLIADRIAQQPMRYEGMVKAIDPDNHTMTVRVHGLDRQFQLANDCKIRLRNDKTGALADIQTGNHVTVTYETPGKTPEAREIAQTSMAFTGTLTAIDLGERTLKAKAAFDTKKFNLADNCAIVINGNTDGQLSDLKPNDRLVFSYDEVNGVNVVNRIAPAANNGTKSVATSTTTRGN